MQNMAIINDQFINSHTNFTELISAIKNEFAAPSIKVPMRHHHDFANPKEGIDSTLLLMPAWNPGNELGVKIVTVSPNNRKYELPSVQGTYIYLDAHKGVPKAILEGKSLTVKRTAATSALAASFLAKKSASSMLMIGTGALSIDLILAHARVRPLKNIYVWGRDIEKAQSICRELESEQFYISAVNTIEEIITNVDLVSCATLSKTPLVLGKYLKEGQHIDLVGSYKKDMREADDQVMSRSNIYLDTYQGGLKESGDIIIPLENKVIRQEDIKADLFELCSNKKPGRTNNKVITVFKSVGHALEDLVAAKYYYNKFMDE